MKILILSATCSKHKYKEICEKRTIKSLDTNQKFFLSIIDGFKDNGFYDITCISVLPVSYGTYSEHFIKRETANEDGIDFVYCKTFNFPIIRNLYASWQMKREVKRFFKQNSNEEIAILTDGLFYEFSKTCDYLHKIGKKVYSIVTDVPSFVSNMGGKTNIKGKLLDRYGRMADSVISNKYDGYVFLTDALNKKLNLKNKPFTIVEGLLGNYNYPEKTISGEEHLPVVLYGGKINKEFGVLNLAKSAQYLHGICDIEIYGANGDCSEELAALSKENDNLRIRGIIPLNELLEKEVKCDLLINPRPNGQYFTEYSFPSKTLEYMSSGTPVLMYKLEGVPEEYDEYLYYIHGNNPEDIAESIKLVLSKPKSELFNKGIQAQKFVREKKNAKIQTRKILEVMNVR